MLSLDFVNLRCRDESKVRFRCGNQARFQSMQWTRQSVSMRTFEPPIGFGAKARESVRSILAAARLASAYHYIPSYDRPARLILADTSHFRTPFHLFPQIQAFSDNNPFNCVHDLV